MVSSSIENLGLPDIEIDGLKIWVHGRQYPEAMDYDDGNWLNITASCESNAARVWTSGNILHLSELEDWLVDLNKINNTFVGEANLNCVEPELNIKLSINKLGQLKMIVKITPDVLMQTHQFVIELDQTYLMPLITHIQKVLSSYPIKAPKKNNSVV